jgi:hypothetical protein
MKGFDKLTTWGVLAVLGLVVAPHFQSAIAQGNFLNPTQPPTTTNRTAPKLLKFELSLSSPKDLKVKAGDKISTGEVVADKVEERQTLKTQRQALELSLQQIQSRAVTIPGQPKPAPSIDKLPPISYTEEEAAISAAKLKIEQAERTFQLQQRATNTEPLSEAAAVSKVAVEVQNQQRLVDNQLRKIEAVALLKNLPSEVQGHEQEVLKRLFAELGQAQAEYQQAQANLGAAKLAQTEKLQQLSEALEKARSEYELATAKLTTAKDKRAYQEYEASITATRRVEEQNQVQQNHQRQLMEVEQQKREQTFQVAQLKGKIGEIDEKLAQLSTVTSPYSGTIRRVKWLGQSDRNLRVELTLVVDGSTSSVGTNDTIKSTKPK